MATLQNNIETAGQSAEEIGTYVSKVAAAYMLDRPKAKGDDRRGAQRINVTMPVLMTPLDRDMQPLGYQCQAVSRDLSTTGVGLITSDPIAPTFVRLSFDAVRGESMEVICRVVFCNDLGYYYQVGCEFLTESQEAVS